jgi:hypothetical protein
MAKTPSTVPNRSCRYCKAKFKPIREDQRFCKPAHRKSFWKYGGLPFDKMKEQIMKDVRKMVRAEIAAAHDDLILNQAIKDLHRGAVYDLPTFK